VPPDNPFYRFINNLYEQNIIGGYACGGAYEPCDAENRPYYRPNNTVTRQQMAKFVDNARRMPGIAIDTADPGAPITVRTTSAAGIGIVAQGNAAGVAALSPEGTGLWGNTGSASHNNAGVSGISSGANGTGVKGTANNGPTAYGVWGESSGIGVYGLATAPGGVGLKGESVNGGLATGVYGVGSSFGVFATASAANGEGVVGIASGANGIGVYGSAPNGNAGFFNGDVVITGACCGASGGSFRMDHPLDPANKYLYHSAVASQEMLNVYNGSVILDGKGEAWVQMPEWFEAVNGDFRYQLTAIGAPGPDLYIAEKVQANRFKIAGGQADMEVSWQVTGVRHDAYAEANRIPVETDKPEGERGMYLHPELYGRPDSEAIGREPVLQDRTAQANSK
jgi:hypothetical protein